ncbi:unnamed protein product [Caenorhabditis sp. 36 PRJEB53466]|nr:unnamed protein product [Caenorhabditis sp. 36 PRJEB53466]
MKLVVLSVCLSVLALGAPGPTTAPQGNVCNYKAQGDESTQKAVPIQDFRSSGLDFIRPNWCITHCADRKSVKAAVRFQFANTSTAVPTYKVRRFHHKESGVKIEKELIGGVPNERDDDPYNFCADNSVSDTVDQVVAQYDDLDTMAEALNYFVNKPQWAFLIYDMGNPPSIIETLNKQMPDGSFALYQVFGGMVKA